MTNEDLCMMIQNGTDKQKCLEQLYAQNSGIIEKTIKRYQGLEDLEDLRQESYFGIVRAAELWEPNKGASFIHYAVFWIIQAVRRYIDNCGGVIRVPMNRRTLIGRYHKIVNAYRVQFGRDPSDVELSFALNLSQDQIENLKRDTHALNVRSISEQIGSGDDDLTLEDTIAAAGDPIGDTIERIQAEQLKARIWSEVDTLPGKQREVIRGLYRDGQSNKECAAALGVSRQRVKIIEYDALRELRRGKHARQLRPFITVSGAYSVGIKSNGFGAFNRYGSTQERAMMRLEDYSGINLWGNRLDDET